MKILLLKPYYGITVHSDMHGDLGTVDYYPHVFPDISFVLSATVASREKSAELDVIDACAERLLPQGVLSRLGEAYDLIVIKASAPSVRQDLEFAKELKNRYINSKVFVGGHVAKVLDKWIRNNIPEIDEVVSEPLEFFMYKLINHTSSVKMDDLPSADYSLLPYMAYKDTEGVIRVSLYMSRGCTTGCSYCPHYAFFGKDIDSRSSEKVIEDIKEVVKLGINNIEFKDQFFTLERDNVVNLCNLIIKNKLNIRWRCQTRLESLDMELIDLMVESGLEVIFFGVESASEDILKSFNRPVNNVQKLKNLIQYLNNKNVITIAFYIVGFPHDTWESVNRTFELSVELKSITAGYFIYNPYVFNDSNYSELEITPELFRFFDNGLTLNVSENLSIEELKFLEFQLPLLYRAYNHDLESAYKYQYIQKYKYANDAKEKIKKLAACSIFEI